MNENTKKDLKDSFETLVIVVLSMFFVADINKRCSSIMQKTNDKKIENVQTIKKHMNISQKVR